MEYSKNNNRSLKDKESFKPFCIVTRIPISKENEKFKWKYGKIVYTFNKIDPDNCPEHCNFMYTTNYNNDNILRFEDRFKCEDFIHKHLSRTDIDYFYRGRRKINKHIATAYIDVIKKIKCLRHDSKHTLDNRKQYNETNEININLGGMNRPEYGWYFNKNLIMKDIIIKDLNTGLYLKVSQEGMHDLVEKNDCTLFSNSNDSHYVIMNIEMRSFYERYKI